MNGRSTQPVAVLIVEDHHLLADGLESALRRAGVHAVVAYPATREDVTAAADRLRPRVVLLDLDLGLTGVDSADLVRSLVDARMTVVLLTGSRDRCLLGRCLDAGARGIASKSLSICELIDVVGAALRSEALPGRDERDALISEVRQKEALDVRMLAPFASLSRREAAVLHSLAEGRSVEAIAAESFVSVATVRTQVRSVLLKLGVNSQLAAVAAARRSGWLETGSATMV